MAHEQIIELAEEQGAVANLKQHFNMAGDSIVFTPEELEAFYRAAIQQYKDSLLKDVGEPVAYMTTDEEGSASMLFFDRAEALKYSGDEEPVNLFTSDQVAAASLPVKELTRRYNKALKQRDELLAAMIHIQQVACSGSPELGIATDAIASVKGEQ